MKVVFTENSYQALLEIQEFLRLKQKLSEEKILLITQELLDCAEELQNFPERGQEEEYLEHLNLNHRRIIVNHCKIIYRLNNNTIFITDFFDTRQNPKSLQKKAK